MHSRTSTGDSTTAAMLAAISTARESAGTLTTQNRESGASEALNDARPASPHMNGRVLPGSPARPRNRWCFQGRCGLALVR